MSNVNAIGGKRHVGMFALIVVFLFLLFVLPHRAYASTVLVDDTSNPAGTAGVTVPDTTVYITNLNPNSATVTVSGGCVRSGTAIQMAAGSTSGSFSVFYPNAGYSTTSEVFDVRLDCTSARVYSAPTSATSLYDIGGSLYGGDTGSKLTFKVTVYKAGTGTQVSGTFFTRFTDLDVTWDDDLRDWWEGVDFQSGWDDAKWLGRASDGPQLNIQGNRYYASHSCDDLNDSSISCIGHSGAVFTWSGPPGCGTGMGIKSVSKAYPSGTTFSKARTSSAVMNSTDSATFELTAWYPDVVVSNQAQAIAVSDKLPVAFDVSRADVKVYKSGTDVTGNWSITKDASTNTITMNANNTSHGYAVGTHTYRITVPLKAARVMSGDGVPFTSDYDLRYTNTASLRIVPKVGSDVTGSGSATVDVRGYESPDYLLFKRDPDLGNSDQGNAKRQGATFSVSYWANWSMSGNPTVTCTMTTDAQGRLNLQSSSWPIVRDGRKVLPWGVYRVVETSAPSGYAVDSTAHTFYVRQVDEGRRAVSTDDGTFSAGANGISRSITEPSVWKGSVRFSKRDSETGGPAQGGASLAGAEFAIVNRSQAPVRYDGATAEPGMTVTTVTCGSDGLAAVSGLPYGTYDIVETKAPSGYHISNATISFSITSNGQVITRTGVQGFQEVVIKGGVRGAKVDAREGDDPQGRASLRGAVIAIRSKDTGAVVATATTDASGYWQTTGGALPFGSYEAYEQSAPTGYSVNSSWKAEFNVIDEGTIVDLRGNVCAETVLCGGVKIGKVDDDTGYSTPQGNGHLDGAKFEVVSQNSYAVWVGGNRYVNGDVVATMTTGADGIASLPVTTLPYGRYIVRESTSSRGYWLSSDEVTFDVVPGQVIDVSAQAFNEPVMEVKLSFKKVDNDLHTTQAQGDTTLAGAKFEIVNESEHAVRYEGRDVERHQVVTTVVTDEEGYAETSSPLSFGTYRVREIEAPQGYDVTTETFRVDITRDADGNAIVTWPEGRPH